MSENAGSRFARPASDGNDEPLGFWIARQPIFDQRRKLAAYELLFRGVRDARVAQFVDGSRATAQVIDQGVMSAVEAVSGGLPMWVNFTQELLIGDHGFALDPKAYVVEVLEDVPPTPPVIEACRRLIAAGYRVALDDTIDRKRVDAFRGAATIVKVDSIETPADRIEEIARTTRQLGMQLLAEKIEDDVSLRRAEELRCDYLQGFYLSKPESLRRSAMPSIQAAHVRLLQAVNRPELDLEEVTSAIDADPSATYRLLRTINSAAYGLNRRVTSIREVVVFLGQDEVRRIATLVMLGSITGSAEHLLLEAVAKARFCDALATELARSGDQQFHYYITGLLSGIDGLLGRPMAEALAPLPIAEEVTAALVEQRGPAADALKLATCYLHGEWFEVDLACTQLGIDEQVLNRIYRNAVEMAEAAVAA
jgi:c-di-GMP-related signal transduction protein